MRRTQYWKGVELDLSLRSSISLLRGHVMHEIPINQTYPDPQRKGPIMVKQASDVYGSFDADPTRGCVAAGD